MTVNLLQFENDNHSLKIWGGYLPIMNNKRITIVFILFKCGYVIFEGVYIKVGDNPREDSSNYTVTKSIRVIFQPNYLIVLFEARKF